MDNKNHAPHFTHRYRRPDRGFAIHRGGPPFAAVLPGLLAAARSESEQRSTETISIMVRQVADRLGAGLAQQWREHEALVRIATTEGLGEGFAFRLDTAKAVNNRLAWMGVAAPDGRVLTATNRVARFLPPAPSGEPTRLNNLAGPVCSPCSAAMSSGTGCDLVRSAPAAQRMDAMLISRDGVVLAGPPALSLHREPPYGCEA